MMKHFGLSIAFSVVCLVLAAFWGFTHGVDAGFEAMVKVVVITVVLAVMEISLSFDNAVVNAAILRDWDEFWKKLFLGLGIIIAVFGMRLIFPIMIVAITAEMGMIDAAKMALNNPVEYSERLLAHHAEISAFGGMFLLLVFLNFVFDEGKDTHWIHALESRLAHLGSVPAIAVFVALLALLLMSHFVDAQHQLVVIMSGVWGIVTYVGVQALGHLLEGSDGNEADDNAPTAPAVNAGHGAVKAGIGGFLYLEVLDASFSFDGVIGAFAITIDVVVIMLGLAIGAMFVRSMTIYLVEKGTLEAFIYLEHGAMYAIGILAFIMLYTGTGGHVPEVVTGLVGIAFIVAAVWSSIVYNKREAANALGDKSS